MGILMNKTLTIKSGQMHAQKYILRLLEHQQKGDLAPSFLLTHKWPLDAGAEGYKMFNDNACMRVAFNPNVVA